MLCDALGLYLLVVGLSAEDLSSDEKSWRFGMALPAVKTGFFLGRSSRSHILSTDVHVYEQCGTCSDSSGLQ